MSHQIVAAVWEQLGRHDVANIVREILGQHAVDLALQWHDGLISNMEELMHAVYWIKVIFDLQRTYLQGQTGVDECHPYLVRFLLPADLVFSTMMYLVQVKSRLFPSATATILEYSKHRYFLAKTLLSGVRVLLLRNEPLSAEKKYNLERAIRAAWQRQQLHLSPPEKHLVLEVLPEAIYRIPAADSGARLQSDRQLWLNFLDKADIPSCATGLYPLNIAPEKFLPEIQATLQEDNRDWIVPFWLIFDIVWAAESSLVRCHADRRYSREHGDETREEEEQFKTVEDGRKMLVIAVLQPLSASNSPFMGNTVEILSQTLLSWDQEDLSLLPVSAECLSHLNDTSRNMDNALGHFVTWLVDRRMQLWDCNGELEIVSQEYHRNLKSWMQTAAYPQCEPPCQGSTRQNVPIYVINCPYLHPVPRDLLEKKMRNADTRGYEALQNNEHFLQVNISCPLCPAGTRVQLARMLEPLEQLSNALHRRADSSSSRRHVTRAKGSADTTSRSDALSHSTSCSSSQFEVEPLRVASSTQPSSVALPSLSSDHSSTLESIFSPVSPTFAISSPRSPTHIQGDKQPTREYKSFRSKFAKKPTSSKTKLKGSPLPSRPHFCFSSSGNSIVFWGDDSNWLMKFDVSALDGRIVEKNKYDIPGLECATVGHQRCAVVTTVGEHCELVILDHHDTLPETSISIESVRRNIPKICMAMSRDDKYVAVAFNEYVYIYQINMGRIRRVHLSEEMDKYQVHEDYSLGTPLISPKRPMNWKEVSQEAQRQGALIERKLSFSTDGKNLIIATHLANHHIYLDVWDCDNEPWNIKPGYSRSFKLPPWTTNDGDLTSVFYDTRRRSAFLTAFLGKEYPLSVPIPGYDHLVNEESSTKVLHAAQSPSGTRFTIVNSMTEVHVYNYKSNGMLNGCRLKRASSKLSSSSFKLGHMALAMPQENIVLLFWIKETKLMLRKIKLDDETYNDYDLRQDYEHLIHERPVVSLVTTNNLKRPSLASVLSSPQVPPSSYSISELPTPSISELPSHA